MQVPKPNHKRRKPKRGQLSKITPKVREEVKHRSGGKCERCGTYQAYSFEMAHLRSAAQLGRGDEPWNVALLCGPSVNSGTCHNWADYTAEGREWRLSKRQELMEYYGVSSNN
ncbi:HNH endonuclease [Oceanobacillus kimchii]|uniref:HNH endonuclease n=1 Tax=Oceanobacillus kimchii TaxID=746691 RepID=UPI0021A6FE4D|nr:HNH endonuclease [Oceanobacillus kimchii]MCT1575665.1 HNH endonuclease [Oceanobacillus kimchii]MCT2137296.1 HNH endonuclease [Oceanobacillus kimchii]